MSQANQKAQRCLPFTTAKVLTIPAQEKPQAVGIPPVMLTIQQAAKLCGVSRATFHRRFKEGKIGPSPVIFGEKKLYVYAELMRWAEAHCPDREQWLLQESDRRNRENTRQAT